jgi:preprotein translocase subunit SecD
VQIDFADSLVSKESKMNTFTILEERLLNFYGYKVKLSFDSNKSLMFVSIPKDHGLDRLKFLIQSKGELQFSETSNSQVFPSSLIYLIDSLNSDLNTPLGFESYSKNGPVVGFAKAEDTSKINMMLGKYLQYPNGVDLKWSYRPHSYGFLEFVAVKESVNNLKVNGSMLLDLEAFEDFANYFSLNIALRKEFNYLLRDFTSKNLEKSVAILVDGQLLSCPLVKAVVSDGKLTLSGAFSKEELLLFESVLKFGVINTELNLKVID